MSTPEVHSEIASVWPFVADSVVTRVVFRYNVFSHLEGTGGLIVEGDDVDVYGNVWFRPSGVAFNTANGAVGTWTASRLTNLRVFNNSFIDLDEMPVIGILNDDDTGEFRNNIVYKSDLGGFGPIAHSHNHYVDVAGAPSEDSGTVGSGDPFANVAALDFRLKAATESGATLVPPFDIDALGLQRGADGTWDRGALEHP